MQYKGLTYIIDTAKLQLLSTVDFFRNSVSDIQVS